MDEKRHQLIMQGKPVAGRWPLAVLKKKKVTHYRLWTSSPTFINCACGVQDHTYAKPYVQYVHDEEWVTCPGCMAWIKENAKGVYQMA